MTIARVWTHLVWDPGTDDISRVSAQEDTTTHTGYGAIQIGVVVGDGV
jgi:hypothetical protein